MASSVFGVEADLWAARIVEGYAPRSRPAMSEEACTILTKHLAQRLRMAMHLNPIGDWPEAANAALDEWEEESRRHGPRVESFDAQTGAVQMTRDGGGTA